MEMSKLTLIDYQRVNDQVTKLTYKGSHPGPKTHLSFKIELTVIPNMVEPDDRVEAKIDFDGKCSGKDILSAMKKLGRWCERIADAVGAANPEMDSYIPAVLSSTNSTPTEENE